MPEPQLLNTYKYVLTIPDIDTIGFFSYIDGLKLSRDVLEYGEGGNNDFVHFLPGPLRYPKLTLRRGFTNQDTLFKWFWGGERKEVTVAIDGCRRFTFAEAFPVDWSGPDSVTPGSSAGDETLEIVHQGLRPA